VAVVFLGLAPFPHRASAAEAVVTSVEFKGNRKIESAALTARLQTKAGEPLDAEVVRADIRSLFRMGYFEHIEAVREEGPGGTRLIFEVTEKPTIAKVDFEGLDALDKDDLKDLVQVKQYEVLDYGKLRTSVEKLLAKYEEKGFYLAHVRYEVKPVSERNEVEVVFKFDENDKVTVRHINIIGNRLISDTELKGIMQTKEGGFFSFLSGSGSYREAIFERDIAALGYYYGTQGYVRARFSKPEISVSPDKKGIYITFFVDEGEKYSVGKIDFTGDLLYNRQELLDDLQLVAGETFNTETLRRETLRYTEKYSDLGYAFANVVPQPMIHDDTRLVDIGFEVDKGERVYIGRILVTGNTKTKDKVLRRELTIHEGELFNGGKKRQSRENVLRLGFFDSVEFHQATSASSPNVVDIDIKVKERSTGQLVIGAGYASGDIGFNAQAQLSQNNFLGNGQVASLSAQVLTGQKFYEFNLSFTEPYVGYSLWSLGGALYQLRRKVTSLAGAPTFEETKSGFDVKLGHPVLEFTNLFLTYKFEKSTVPETSIVDRTLIPKNSVNGYTSSVTTSFVYDKRDDRFDPRDGLFGSLSSEVAGLGGDRRFLKSRATMKFFHPIVWDFVFRLHMTGANIMPIGADPVPINELFILGGLFNLRGYDFLTVGPKRTVSRDPSVLSADAVKAGLPGKEITIGGHNELLMNAEIEFPLLKEARIRGVFFFDVGNTFDGVFRNANPKLYANLGWGFRWFTPIGPLRFEFGYPIVQGGSPKFYFTIGPPF